jgi:hypothetical protein
MPVYSGNTVLEIAGPIYATIGKYKNQMAIEPGIAMKVYFVQILFSKTRSVHISYCFDIKLVTYSVINAPFHKIQPSTAVNTTVPTHHCPPFVPFMNTPSFRKQPTPVKKRILKKVTIRLTNYGDNVAAKLKTYQ